MSTRTKTGAMFELNSSPVPSPRMLEWSLYSWIMKHQKGWSILDYDSKKCNTQSHTSMGCLDVVHRQDDGKMWLCFWIHLSECCSSEEQVPPCLQQWNVDFFDSPLNPHQLNGYGSLQVIEGDMDNLAFFWKAGQSEPPTMPFESTGGPQGPSVTGPVR